MYTGPARLPTQRTSSKSSALSLSADYQKTCWQSTCKDGCNGELHQTIASSSLDVVASMDIDSPKKNLGSEPRFAFVMARDGDVKWAQDHDNKCTTYQAQHLVECVLQSLIDIRMMQPQNDFSLAYLIGWVTDQLEMRDCLPCAVEDIANIFGALDFLWFAPKEVWTEGCIGGCISSWNCPVDDKLQCFSHPAATSIFVYRKASPGDFPVCSCADAEAVEESRLHIWLYAEENEGAKSYRWIPQTEVRAFVHNEEAVLSEHLIFQRFLPGKSIGPPMLRCIRGQGTLPDDFFFDQFNNPQVVWKRSEPARICASRLRCEQCGLLLPIDYFSTPKIETDSVRRPNCAMEWFCTVWCSLCKEKYYPCKECKHHKDATEYTPSMWTHRFTRPPTCIECQEEARKNCESCGYQFALEKKRCSECGMAKPQTHFSPSMWHHKGASDRTIKCLECEAKMPTARCDICHTTKPTQAFPASAISHQTHNQNTRCYDCSHPPCMFLPNCMTCARCRDSKSQAQNCTRPIQTLNSNYLPKNYEEVKSFACDRCQYIRCIAVKPDGTRCGKMRSRKKHSQARQSKQDFICAECRP